MLYVMYGIPYFCIADYCCPIKLQYSNKVWLERLIFSVRVFFFILQAPPNQKEMVRVVHRKPWKGSFPSPFRDC